MKTKDLLIEIGTEELPPKHLKKCLAAFIEALTHAFREATLDFNTIEGFITPRRLAARVLALSVQQPDYQLSRKGPAKSAAFDTAGNPTKAALGFAASCGVPFEKLKVQEEEKGAWLCFDQHQTGRTVPELLLEILEKTLTDLPLGRKMRWGDTDHTFARPVHWIVLLWGEEPLHLPLFNLTSSNITFGHRFHQNTAIRLSAPTVYETLLEQAFVIPSFDKRQEKIKTEIEKIAAEKQFIPILTQALLDEVTGLVEYPVVLLGSFNPNYLNIPKEVLITAMQTHQRCFAVMDKSEKLLPYFLITSNIQSKDANTVIRGNESVIEARLHDAAFYYEVDQKTSLEKRREDLKQVRYQQNLGNLWDKTERIATTASFIATQIAANSDVAKTAGLLCKSDLLTQMVGEFPELQGIMGYYYAKADNVEAVAIAIRDHYYPRFAEDILPQIKEGLAVSLADKADALIGLFAINAKPTGDKDPFGLRRQALGLLRLLIESKIDFDLKTLLETVHNSYSTLFSKPAVISEVLSFCFERLRAWYLEQGVSIKIFEAVLVKELTNPFDFHQRIQAVKSFVTYDASESLSAANKRVQNILKNQEAFIFGSVDQTLLQEKSEKDLFLALNQKKTEIAPLLQTKQYTEALIRLSSLKEPIDQFFLEVMVMVEDENLRKNRLNLLQQLRLLFLDIADISLL